jgi:amidophosphoribosyltransferase
MDEIRQFIGADTLGYLSLDGLLKSVNGSGDTFCSACFSGKYPIPVQLEMDKLALERP